MDKSVYDVIKHGNCMSCGLCFSFFEKLKTKHGCLFPDTRTEKDEKFPVEMCPGKGYDITALSAGDATFKCMELGSYRSSGAYHTTNDFLKTNAASGGVMSAIAAYMLETGKVDGAIVTKLLNNGNGIAAETFVAHSLEDLKQAQGSKYMPVSALQNIRNIIEKGKKYLFIGTPCQIAGIRLMQKIYPEYRDSIVLTVGNFCGGFRDFREQNTIFKLLGISGKDVVEMSYRRGKQPGYMLIKTADGKEFHLSYPQYARMTGFQAMRRCRTCVDATAELADISCGDAWIERFLDREESWSLALGRSDAGKNMLEEMVNSNALAYEAVSQEEVILSQKTNINAKKRRQNARRKLYSLLGVTLPEFNGGYDQTKCRIGLEIKVLFRHFVYHTLELVGLYRIFAKLMNINKCKIEVIKK